MALPNQINNAVPAGNDLPSTIDNRIRNLATAVEDIFGVPDATNISAAGFGFVAGGLTSVNFQDANAASSTAGRLQRNGANLSWHDGTAARNIIIDTYSGANLTSPNITGGVVTVNDDQFFLRDNADNTKRLQFELSGITTATLRTLTAPDANTVIVGTDTTQTLSNKTFSTVVSANAGANISGTVTMVGTASPIVPASVVGTPAQHALYRENVVKAWAQVSVTPTLNDSFNLSSVADGGVGVITVTWDRDFVNTTYSAITSASASGYVTSVSAYATGTCTVNTQTIAGPGTQEDIGFSLIAIGDQ